MTLAPESRFTRPRPDCPNPEYWHSTDDDSTEVEVTALVAAMVTGLQPEHVIETGTAWGQTAQAIGQALLANGHGHLTTLEPDHERAEASRVRCEGLPVTVLEVPSLEFVPEQPVDFAWFDSLLHLRADELRKFAPHMTPRAVIGFHDTAPHHPLRPDLTKLVTEGLITPPLYLPTPRGVCFARLQGGI